MHVDVERRPGSQVALTVSVEPDVLKQRMEQLYQKLASRVKVPGFRPGKAPRQFVDAKLDRDALMRNAVESVIESTFKEALRDQQIELLEQAEVEDIHTGDDLTLTYRAVFYVRPPVTLPEVAALEVNYTSTKVTDEQIEAEIERLRQRDTEMSELAETPIQMGDVVTIDYTVQINGVPYPEGELAGYPLEVGADTVFPELNESLLGAKAGETRIISKTYPEDYQQQELAGNTAQYAVTIRQLRRRVLPEVTDAWVAARTSGSLQTLDELRERLRSNMEGMSSQMDHDQIREALVRQVVAKAELDIPDLMVQEEYKRLMQTLEERAAREYLTLEEYAEHVHRSVAELRNEQMLMARDYVRRSLVLQEVARRAQITVTDEDIDTFLIMERYQRGEHDVTAIRHQLKSIRKEMKTSGRLEHMANLLYHEKILRYLEQQAQVMIDGKLLQQEPAAPEQDADTGN